jgi:hypothetical protein
MRSLAYSSAGPIDRPPLSTPYAATVQPVPQSSLSNSSFPRVVHPPSLHHHELTAQTPQPITPGYPFFTVDNNHLYLSTQSRRHITRAIQNSWADVTIQRYSSTIKKFIRFCDAERVPEHLRFPADEFLLCTFAASSLGRHAVGTARARLSALKAWHTTHNVEWKGSARLRYVLNGIRNLAPMSSRQHLRPPISADMLIRLINNLDLTLPLDVVIAACAVTAFWGQCRLGELLPLSSLAPNISSLPKRSNFKCSLRNPQSCVLRLPSTKADRHGQDVVLVDQRAPINPISLLKTHIRVNRVANDEHLFSYTSETTGQRVALTKRIFMQRCNAIWQPLGYPRTTGHCFRIGGTTELLIAGIPDVVRATGRWSSESFLRYWRSLDILAPIHIRNIHTFRNRRRRR